MSRKRPTDHEHKEAVLLMEWVRLAKGARPALKRLFHIPNGGKRSKIAGAKLKAEGVRKGVSDYLLPVAMPIYGEVLKMYHGLWIELKVKGNYPEPDQHEFMNDMRDEGYAVYWCNGWDEAREILIAYLDVAKEIPGRDPKPRGTYKLKP